MTDRESDHIVSELLWIGFDPHNQEVTLAEQFRWYAPRFNMTANALEKTWRRAQKRARA